MIDFKPTQLVQILALLIAVVHCCIDLRDCGATTTTTTSLNHHRPSPKLRRRATSAVTMSESAGNNPLSSIAAKNWIIPDGSENGNVVVSDNLLTMTQAKQGTPLNARLDDNDNITAFDDMYYEVTIREMERGGNSLAVGFVTKDHFLPGWKTKGFFYNGNVTNGSAGLIIGFADGDYPKSGDTIGVRARRQSDDALEVGFYHNNRSLGVAFRIANFTSEDDNVVLYPCLHMSGKVVVEYSAPSSLPPGNMTREQVTYPDGDYSGQWKLIKAFAGPELGEMTLPESHDTVLTMSSASPMETSDAEVKSAGEEEGTTTKYDMTIKVANTISAQITSTGKDEEGFDRISVQTGRSTMMMAMPPLDEIERYYIHNLPTLYKMIISEGVLLMTGPTAEMQYERYHKVYEPLTKY